MILHALTHELFKGELVFDDTISRGDLLHVPRGYVHHAMAGNLSLSPDANLILMKHARHFGAIDASDAFCHQGAFDSLHAFIAYMRS